MAIMYFYSVNIEFATSPWGRQRSQGGGPHDCTVRLVESRRGPAPQFTLYDGERPLSALAATETNEMLRLLSQVTMQAPWDARVGRDGATFTLRLEGPMSYAEFNWWLEVPKGWESIGAVFDYAMSLAKRYGHGSALCG
jgi:hypothetical protein